MVVCMKIIRLSNREKGVFRALVVYKGRLESS